MTKSATKEEQMTLGDQKIEWAKAHCRVLAAVVQDHLSHGELEGHVIGVDLPLEAKTAVLCLALADAGATVVVSADPYFIVPEIAEALRRRGVLVVGNDSESGEGVPLANQAEILRHEPTIIVDGAGQLGGMLHSTHVEAGRRLVGIAEETTTGVRRYERMAAAGVLTKPVIVANNARMKHLFDNRYGTGQAGLGAFMSVTNLMVPGKRFTVLGYGWVGRGVARFASAMGARVSIAEVDPVRGVEAYADGYDVLPLLEQLPGADIVVNTTGTRGAVTVEHMKHMKDGVILENVGGTSFEIDVAGLRATAMESRVLRPHIERFTLPDGRNINLLGDGALLNLTSAAEGNPIEIIDTTFAIQALCVAEIARHGSAMAPGVYPVPADFDDIVARTRLRVAGMAVDTLSAEQVAALEGWIEE